MTKIYIDLNAVRDKAMNMKSSSEALVSYTRTLDQTVKDINNVWQGNDAMKYINKVKDELVSKLETLSANLNEYSAFLQGIPKMYDDFDEEEASSVRRSSSNE